VSAGGAARRRNFSMNSNHMPLVNFTSAPVNSGCSVP
jgi:hypothetical protein